MTSPLKHDSGSRPAAESATPLYDVFLSHSSDDTPAIEVIGNRLRTVGLTPFLDKWHLKPGEPFQSGLAEALDASACFAFFLGKTDARPWHNEEMQFALNKAVRTRNDYRVIPVVLPGSDPSFMGTFVNLRTWVDFRAGLDDEEAFQRLVAGIKGVAPDSAKGLLKLPDEPRPYRGIKHFGDSQHEFYFGRNGEIQRLTARLQKDCFVAVVGGSGCGKSSLVRAGLCSDVAAQAMPGIRNWHRIAFMPGRDPLLQLAASLVAHLPEAERMNFVQPFTVSFATSAKGLATALMTLFPNRDPILLLIDQFEELFTQGPATNTEQPAWSAVITCFAANLRFAIDHSPEWLHVIVTLRSDFLDRFVTDDFPDFRVLLERQQFWVAAMTEDDIREAVVRPAAACGAYFEKGLVERILSDLGGQFTALPLLEEAMDILWDKRHGPWLTHQVYTEIGGVGGALADKANRVFNSLSASQQVLARQLFLRLVRLGEGSRDTRRRVGFGELMPVTEDPAEFQSVLESFSRARLITLSSNLGDSNAGNGSEKTAEVAHEALIDHWGLLRRWLNEGREDVRLDHHLSEAALRWEAEGRKKKGKPNGLLWRPPELDLGRELAKRTSFSDLQRRFLDHSRKAEKMRKMRVGSAVLGLFLLLGLGIAFIARTAELAFQKRGEVIRRHEAERANWKKTQETFADLLNKSNGVDNLFEQARNAITVYEAVRDNEPESLDTEALRHWARRFGLMAGFLGTLSSKEREELELHLHQTALGVNLLGLEKSLDDPLFARGATEHAYAAAELLPATTREELEIRYAAYLRGLAPGGILLKNATADQSDFNLVAKLLRRLGSFAEKTGRRPEAREFWAECRDVANNGERLGKAGSSFTKLFREDALKAEQELERLGRTN